MSLNAAEIHLEDIAVHGHFEDEYLEQTITKESSSLAKSARGETLGDYLQNETFVESASYGPAVGRPVVKGMDGYRVGVTTGNVVLNDVSAMSQDHAVGVMPRATKKIELIKGPASLLYGSYSGGVIRTLGEEHEREFLKEGYALETTSSYGSNGAGMMLGASGEAREGDISLSINSFYHDAEDFRDGDGNSIKDSNTMSRQSHAVLGYRVNDENNIKLYYDNLAKDYGIPNSTPRTTSIDMTQER